MQRNVTIKTIAGELNLSVSAVSKALNNYPDIPPETRARVAEKAAELGYSPNMMARSLVKKTSNFVGIVIRDVSTVYGEMFKALNDVAREHDLNLILYDTNRDAELEKACIQNLIDSMAMGIIVAPVSKDVTEIDRMCHGRVPVVYLGGRVSDEKDNFVAADGVAGAEIALSYLTELGHRNIALICDNIKSASRNSKLIAYKEKMKALGRPELIFSETEPTADIIESGYRQAKKMLACGQGVSAVFVVKDIMAIGVMKAIREAGLRVPEDISVIGYDGIDAAALPMIELTTVAQPRREMAAKVIEILLRHVEDRSLEPEHYYARPVLTGRKSCCPKGDLPLTEESIDVLDACGRRTGETKPRSTVHKEGLLHRTVHIWITDRNGNILLQRRAKSKDLFPDMLDISCAGHLSAGDSSLQGALRELAEELGLSVAPDRLEYIGTLQSAAQGPGFIDNEFNDIYLLQVDVRAEDLVFQREEISEVFFVSPGRFRDMVSAECCELVDHSREYRLLLDKL